MNYNLYFENSLFFEGLIDTHVHFLHIAKNNLDVISVIDYCFKNGFSYFIDIGLSPGDYYDRKLFLNKYSKIFLTAGIHPLHVNLQTKDQDISLLENIINSENIIAIGELGLDYLSSNNISLQKDILQLQLDLASKYKKPIIVHVREAYLDVYDILKSNKYSLGGIIHCFSGTYEMAKKFVNLGFKISFSGNLTFKNSIELRKTVSNLNIKDVLIETDSPYLAPVPLRGKVNIPNFLGYTCLELAKIKNFDTEYLINSLYQNLKDLFPTFLN